MKKIFLMFILLFSLTHVCAFENEYFKLDVPESMTEEINELGLYKWSNDNDYISITVVKNNIENKYNIENFDDEDLTNYKKYLEESFNNALTEYDLKIEVSNIKKENINDLTALSYDVLWPTKESIGYDTYQKGYSFTTNKYVIMFTYSSNKEITDDNEDFINSLNSFKIIDKKITNEGFFSKKRNRILVIGSVAGVIGYIISASKKRKK